MDSAFGDFLKEEVDGKTYLIYHHNNPVIDSGKSDDENFLSQPLFLCPRVRRELAENRFMDRNNQKWQYSLPLEFYFSPYFNGVVQRNETESSDYNKERLDPNNHPVFPLFWCKTNKDYDFNDLKIGPDYYLCVKCDVIHEKLMLEVPAKINHPFHPLTFAYSPRDWDCAHCEKPDMVIGYNCTICDLRMDLICGLKPIPLVMDRPKRHDHPLAFFTRKTCLDCNVCGLIIPMHSTYVCLKCDFVAHQDCVDSPSIIRISRHYHRISYTSSLPSGKWSCGVCRKSVDSEYGAYICKKCDGCVVHSKCALRKDIWDGKELEGIPEEDDIEEVADPFEWISDGIILHFTHDHCLKLETNEGVYDENKICHACLLPIYEGDFYTCTECDFIIHDTCANAPRRIRHSLHPYPLTLKVTNGHCDKGYFRCDACNRRSSGFVYECNTEERSFKLDVRCASISEPFDYQGHEHPLFFALDPRKTKPCQGCGRENKKLINCIECDFIRCLECITIPYITRYKHDKHFLELSYWDMANEPDWCEVCETLIFSEYNDQKFYRCKQCCTTLHLECLLGKDPYI